MVVLVVVMVVMMVVMVVVVVIMVITAPFSRQTDTFVSQMFAPHLDKMIMIRTTVVVLMLTVLRMELTVHLKGCR